LLAEIEAAPDNKRETSLVNAKTWLSTLLANGELAQKEIAEAARANGISYKTLCRAKTDLNIKSRKDGLNGWFWGPSE
jgi:putative DNA primase/helicase